MMSLYLMTGQQFNQYIGTCDSVSATVCILYLKFIMSTGFAAVHQFVSVDHYDSGLY